MFGDRLLINLKYKFSFYRSVQLLFVKELVWFFSSTFNLLKLFRTSAYRWRTISFPWFDDILELPGETLQPGKYRCFGAIDEGCDNKEALLDLGTHSPQARPDDADEEEDNAVHVETVAGRLGR